MKKTIETPINGAILKEFLNAVLEMEDKRQMVSVEKIEDRYFLVIEEKDDE